MLDAVAIKKDRPKSNFMMCFYTLQIFTIHSPELYGKSNRIWGKLKRNLLKRHIKKFLVCAKTISNQQRILKIFIPLDVNNLQSWNYMWQKFKIDLSPLILQCCDKNRMTVINIDKEGGDFFCIFGLYPHYDPWL